MAVFYERKDRPGVHKIIGSLKGVTLADAPTPTPGGGDEPAAASLYVSPEGVLISTGAAPKMDGTTLVYTPTPTMADTVMTIS